MPRVQSVEAQREEGRVGVGRRRKKRVPPYPEVFLLWYWKQKMLYLVGVKILKKKKMTQYKKDKFLGVYLSRNHCI